MQIRLASVSDTNPSGVQEDVSLEFSKSSALICTGCLIYKQYNLLTLVTHKLEVDQLFFFLSPVALSLVAKRELCPRSWSLQHIFKGEESTDQVLPFKHASLSYLFSSRSPLPAPHLLVWTDYIVLFFFNFLTLLYSHHPSRCLIFPPHPLSLSLPLSVFPGSLTEQVVLLCIQGLGRNGITIIIFLQLSPLHLLSVA